MEETTKEVQHRLVVCDIMSIATSALAQDVIMRMPTLVIALTSDDINIRYKNANSNYISV